MLLEEDRGSKGQRGGQGCMSQGGVEGLEIKGVGAEEFGDGVCEGGKKRG